jgi:hypothetical protein
MDGAISEETIDIILRRHGGTLRSLSVHPYPEDDGSQFPLVAFSQAVAQRLAEQCPNLERLKIPINRTRGDGRETGIYRALSMAPRLKRAFLTLKYRIGPGKENEAEEERKRGYPVSTGSFSEDIHPAYLSEAFSNSAIDSTLARSILNLISSGGSLRFLRLEIRRKVHRSGWGVIDNFACLLGLFNRDWICKRDAQGKVTVRDVYENSTLDPGEEWRYNEEEVFTKAFQDVWPSSSAEWWNEWRSLPLSDA